MEGRFRDGGLPLSNKSEHPWVVLTLARCDDIEHHRATAPLVDVRVVLCSASSVVALLCSEVLELCDRFYPTFTLAEDCQHLGGFHTADCTGRANGMGPQKHIDQAQADTRLTNLGREDAPPFIKHYARALWQLRPWRLGTLL